jgi:hypothetical protein
MFNKFWAIFIGILFLILDIMLYCLFAPLTNYSGENKTFGIVMIVITSIHFISNIMMINGVVREVPCLISQWLVFHYLALSQAFVQPIIHFYFGVDRMITLYQYGCASGWDLSKYIFLGLFRPVVIVIIITLAIVKVFKVHQEIKEKSMKTNEIQRV